MPKYYQVFILSLFLFSPLVAISQEPLAFLPENIKSLRLSTLRECPPEASVMPFANPSIRMGLANKTKDIELYNLPANNYNEIIVDEDGWYNLYNMPFIDSPFESGPAQRNESFFVAVNNGYNPEGKPVSGNCGGHHVVKDLDNDPANPMVATDLQFAGTFYLVRGNNPVTLNHFCRLYNEIGEDDPSCNLIHDDTENSQCQSVPLARTDPREKSFSYNSISGQLAGYCAVPTNGPARLLEQEEPRMFEDFNAHTVTEDFIDDKWLLAAGRKSVHTLHPEQIHRNWRNADPVPGNTILWDIWSPGFPRTSSMIFNYRHNWNIEQNFYGQWLEMNMFQTQWAPGSFSSEDTQGHYMAHYLGEPNKVFTNWVNNVWKNYEYTGSFSLKHDDYRSRDFLNGSIYITFYSDAPYSSSMNYIHIKDGNQNNIRIMSRSNGTVEGSENSISLPINAETNYRFKVQARTGLNENNFRIKLWRWDESEPSEFQLEQSFDRFTSPAGGVVGFGASAEDSDFIQDSTRTHSSWHEFNTVQDVLFDDIRVVPLPSE